MTTTAVCAVCRSEIRVNEILGISFCEIHGFSQPFTFVRIGLQRSGGA
jgi:hypothetical protein